jgi:hypothetical protein
VIELVRLGISVALVVGCIAVMAVAIRNIINERR